MDGLNVAFLISGAFGVAGVLQYAKGLLPKAPTWLWQAVSPVACVGVAITYGGDALQVAQNAVLLLAMTQLMYETVIQLVKKSIERLGGMGSDPASSGSTSVGNVGATPASGQSPIEGKGDGK
jgi:hypothetical protein